MIEDDPDTIIIHGISDSTDMLWTDLEEEMSFDDFYSPLTTSLSSSYGGYSSTYPATAMNSTSGTVGSTLSTTLNNGLIWNNPSYTATASPYSNTVNTWTTYNNQPQVLKVNGDAEFDGDVKIKGVNLSERLDAIEERLGILRPNNDLEGKWEKLKKLGDEYRKLEKEILEGENIWDMLKK